MTTRDNKNNKIIRKPNAKTNIVDKVNHYHKIVNVKNQTVFKKKYGALEYGLGKCLEIFFNTEFKGGSKKKELRVYEIKNGKIALKTKEKILSVINAVDEITNIEERDEDTIIFSFQEKSYAVVIKHIDNRELEPLLNEIKSAIPDQSSRKID